MPEISALIVNYRAYSDLVRCLSSLEAEGSSAPAIVVVDHGSDGHALQPLREQFPAVHFIPVPANDGFAAGVNRAAAVATGRYLLVLNPDTAVGPGLCGQLGRFLDTHPDVGVVGPKVLDADGSTQASARRFPGATTALAGRSSWLTRAVPGNPLSRYNLATLDAPRDPIEVDWVSGACMMIRREAFDAVGGFDEGFFLYWEDADFCRRVKQAGWQVVYCPQASVTHLGGRSSRVAARDALVAFHRSAFRLYWKHGSLLARALAPLVYLGLQARLLLMLLVRRGRS